MSILSEAKTAWRAQPVTLAGLILLAGSGLALLLAPRLMPASFSWVRHTTSESAAQGIEGVLHSVAASAMGFAFAIGVAWRLFLRRAGAKGRGLDWLAVVAATAVPLAMSALPEWDGLLQRIMISIAYIWYGFAFWEAGMSWGSDRVAYLQFFNFYLPERRK